MGVRSSSVLVVDDNPVNREILMQLLTKQGYSAISVDNGRQALEVIETQEIDLVLLDILMPEMNGFEVLKQIKATPHLRNLPVVMISSLEGLNSLVKCIELGADDYISKPFNHVLLKARIEASLEKKRLQDQEQAFLIAAQRQAEEALHESEKRLHTVISNVPVTLFALDSKGRYSLLEGKGLEGLDINPEDLLGQSVMEAHLHLPQLGEDILRIPPGESYSTTVETDKGGWEVHSNSILGANEKSNSINGIVIDITERLHHERELKAIVTFSAELRATQDRRGTFHVILEQLLQLMNVNDGAIALLAPGSEEAQIELASGVWEDRTSKSLSVGQEFISSMLARSQPYLNGQDTRPINSFSKQLKNELPYIAYMPLIAEEQVIGVLWVGRHDRAVSENEKRLFAAISEIAANAIHRVILFEDLRKKNGELMLAYDITIEGWTRALALRDRETNDHTQRMLIMTMDLARAVGENEEEICHIYRGVLLHDIGKMAIPDNILLKPGSLNPEEWEILRKHPEYAYDMLSPISYLKPALDIPYYHHENWDGTGYPKGLKGEQIPISARIFTIVDVWDALRSDRPYRKAWPESRVMEYIRDQAGKKFDPAIVEAFNKLIGDKELELQTSKVNKKPSVNYN